MFNTPLSQGTVSSGTSHIMDGTYNGAGIHHTNNSHNTEVKVKVSCDRQSLEKEHALMGLLFEQVIFIVLKCFTVWIL